MDYIIGNVLDWMEVYLNIGIVQFGFFVEIIFEFFVELVV